MALNLNNKETALLVIDMQHGFLSDFGGMARLGYNYKLLRDAIPGCEKLVDSARKSSIPIFFTKYVYEPDFRDGGVQVEEISLGIKDSKLCAAGSKDAEIIENLVPKKGEVIIEKNRPSSFYATRLESYLRAQKIKTLVLCGVTTNICVESTARDAAQKDYKTYVVKDSIAEIDEFRHEVAIKAMQHMFAKIVTVEEVVNSWGHS